MPRRLCPRACGPVCAQSPLAPLPSAAISRCRAARATRERFRASEETLRRPRRLSRASEIDSRVARPASVVCTPSAVCSDGHSCTLVASGRRLAHYARRSVELDDAAAPRADERQRQRVAACAPSPHCSPLRRPAQHRAAGGQGALDLPAVPSPTPPRLPSSPPVDHRAQAVSGGPPARPACTSSLTPTRPRLARWIASYAGASSDPLDAHAGTALRPRDRLGHAPARRGRNGGSLGNHHRQVPRAVPLRFQVRLFEHARCLTDQRVGRHSAVCQRQWT